MKEGELGHSHQMTQLGHTTLSLHIIISACKREL